MHHVMTLIAERQIGLCCGLYALCPRLDAKILSSQGSHWKQPLSSYGVEIRLSTSYPPQTLP
ncbi:hypothetical protein Hanom_Chr11g00973781 [Helianthus anomalus]